MYQVIVYDCSGVTPLIIDRAYFDNEDCAWAWYDEVSTNSVFNNGKEIPRKRVEFKCGANTDVMAY